MNVLIPTDIGKFRDTNPYSLELLKHLKMANCNVSNGRFWLYQDGLTWDIINIHWPEWLIATHPPSKEEVDHLITILKYQKKTSKIVVTVHNDLPHRDKSSLYFNLYKRVYELADGFIHMGNESIKSVHHRFPVEVKGKKHTVIAHGNYAVFGDKVAKKIARAKHGFPDMPLALIVGAIRNSEELRLILASAKTMNTLNGKVVFAGTFLIENPQPRSVIQILKRLMEECRRGLTIIKLYASQGLIYMPGKVPFEKMSSLVSSTDILIIPRMNILNSGNVPLGFTYGCVVVGPSVGNVGELLAKHDNSIFNPQLGISDLDRAIKEAIQKSHDGYGIRNRDIAITKWNWDKIARDYKLFLEDILSNSA